MANKHYPISTKLILIHGMSLGCWMRLAFNFTCWINGIVPFFIIIEHLTIFLTLLT